MTTPTKAQIEKFIRIRNKSGFASNLQFMIDAQEAGFHIDDLPKAEALDDGAYAWDLGEIGQMIEHGGRLKLINMI